MVYRRLGLIGRTNQLQQRAQGMSCPVGGRRSDLDSLGTNGQVVCLICAARQLSARLGNLEYQPQAGETVAEY